MLAGYGLKVLEYTLYALAVAVAVALAGPESIRPTTPDDIVAVVFILAGIGILLPRTIAYLRWPKVIARVGSYRGTWDGEQSASFSYEFGNQQYVGSFRAMYGVSRVPRVQLCVNPRAPWVRYPVFSNVWLCGVAFVGLGIFLLLSDQSFFG
ncbi:hypothetical protein [Yoonia sp.]|uniref:hypothetical protein n=1 Tax=Yoonia sp. TaxID=2212373 RepID=UPI002DFFD91E|nr:hypothetical protein [Yoonia sp.]